MTPDELVQVERSWAVLRRRREAFIERLAAALDSATTPRGADEHARLLVDVADQLVGALATPSLLQARARTLLDTRLPEALVPRCGTDGVAWRRAASEVCIPWSSADDTAWSHAWLLLADVLAADSLAPFDGPLDAHAVAPVPPT
jgi:hypothetical protein